MRRERQTIIPSKRGMLPANTRPRMSRAKLRAIAEIDYSDLITESEYSV